MENKAQFVRDVVNALVANGDGCHDWMADCVRFEGRESGTQVIHMSGKVIDVTCDSPASIAQTIIRHM